MAIEKKKVTQECLISDQTVKVAVYDEINCNILRLSVGTNTPSGGDSGHGGRTLFEIADLGSTAWQVTVKAGDKLGEFDQPDRLTIILEGDSEADTFLGALERAVKVLKAQRASNEGGPDQGRKSG